MSTAPPTATAAAPGGSNRFMLVGLVLAVAAGGAFLAWHFFFRPKPIDEKPQPQQSADMAKALKANLRGIGHLGQGDKFYPEAVTDFEEAVQAAPDWTPAQVNLGIALLNTATQENLDRAIKTLEAVVNKEPENAHAHYCLGIIAKYQGRVADAYPHFEAVSRIDPGDAHTWLQMGQLHPRGKESAEAKECFVRALKLDPYLNSARYMLAQHPVGRDPEVQKKLLDEFQAFDAVKWANTADLKYTYMGPYAEPIGKVPAPKSPAPGPLPLFEKWGALNVKLAPKTTWAKPADLGELPKLLRERFGAAVVFLDYNRDGKLDLFLPSAGVREGKIGDLLLRNDGGGTFTDVTADAGLTASASFGCFVADYDNDGRPDLLLTSAGHPRLWRNAGTKFEDVSAAAGLDKLTGFFLSASWLDLDQDGDLDLVLSRLAESTDAIRSDLAGKGAGTGEVIILLNTGEAKPIPEDRDAPALTTAFKPFALPEAARVRGAVAFTAAGDLDGDRDMDLLVLVGGKPAMGIWNDRLLRFRPTGPLGAEWAWNGALLLDANHDGRSDLLLLATDAQPQLWLSKTVREPADLLEAAFAPGAVSAQPLRQAQAVDLDLDSWPDVVGLTNDGRPVLLRNDGAGKLSQSTDAFGTADTLPANIQGIGVADLDGDGNADLVLLAADGLHVRRSLDNGNAAVRIDPTGKREPGAGTMRSNADGIGAWVTAQSGSLWSGAERTATQSGLGRSLLPVELGVGKATEADLVRITWPDGVPQWELGIQTKGIRRIQETERRTTSCPVLFVWDGTRYRYVTDFLGAGALGETGPDGSARPPRPEESVKIEPGMLAAKDGWYQLRITEPMDEVLYLDRLQLVAVDHPKNEAVYPDERFVVAGPPPTQELLHLRDLRPAKQARDHAGAELTATLRERDGVYADKFRRRAWLGYAEEHWAELDFGDVPPPTKGERLVLCLAGWTDYPFPESIFAAGQAGVELHAPQLEYPAADGSWKPWGELGFPAGLPRVMTRDVTELVALGKGRCRIRTNMQVFWDQIQLGRAAAEAPRATTLEVGRATLRHRGFNQEVLPGGKPPVVYEAERTEQVAVTRWQGRLTRLGDVTELLTAHDDRFVIAGPGDEIEIGFDARALPLVKEGMVRSFVLKAAGYSKDTSPFTLTGGSVEPLPFRAMPNYPPASRSKPPAAQQEYDRTWNTRPAGQ
jgi:tetratricopeptide (TPR) repeat protein